jgi:phosphopantetheinyl transferase
MALYKHWHTEEDTTIAIWKVEEPEDFFVRETGFHSNRKHAIRRIEHVTGRFLLRYLDPEFPIHKIEISPLRKPYLPPDENRHFSISHSFPYIAAAISRTKNIGVDIQIFREKIFRLQHKFLSEKELRHFHNDIGKLTLAWSVKEAVFKWFGAGELDFIEHMPIQHVNWNENPLLIQMDFRKTSQPQLLRVEGYIDTDFSFAFLLQ